MSEAEHLSNQIAAFYRDSNQPWIPCFESAIAGLTAEQGAVVPAPGFNSVWSVVKHVAFLHETVLRRLRNLPEDEEELSRGGWFPAGANDMEWQQDCERLSALNEQVAAEIEGLSSKELDQPFAEGRALRWQMIHGLIAHTSFHVCEIVSIRQLQGSWSG